MLWARAINLVPAVAFLWCVGLSGAQAAEAGASSGSTAAAASTEFARPAPSPPGAGSTVRTNAPGLSRAAEEIADLSRAHVEEKVILAYIQTAARPYHLAASDVKYLRELGVSTNVLEAMLRHDQVLDRAAPGPAADRIIGHIVRPGGQEVVVRGSASPDRGYWTPLTTSNFWATQNESHRAELRLHREVAEQAQQAQVAEAASRARALAWAPPPPNEAAARKSPAEVQAILREALHQATLDVTMEDPDGNAYAFLLPPSAKLPDRLKRTSAAWVNPTTGEVLAYVLPGQEVAALPPLRKAWFEAELVSIQPDEGPQHRYDFAFPIRALEKLGLLELPAN
jgi:hypothetical protein